MCYHRNVNFITVWKTVFNVFPYVSFILFVPCVTTETQETITNDCLKTVLFNPFGSN